MAYRPRRLEVSMDELDKILARAKPAIDPDDHEKLRLAIETLGFLSSELESKNVSLRRLRRMLFGPSTEKTREVCKPNEASAPTTPATTAGGQPPGSTPKPEASSASSQAGTTPPPKRKGHGRNGAADYTGLPRETVSHPDFKPGQPCPGCKRGTLARDEAPDVLVRITACPPIYGKRIELEKLRCTACRCRYKTPAPPEVGEEKYDDSVRVMTGLYKYGMGQPFFRLARLQDSFGIPFPASTQFQLVAELVPKLNPVLHELIRQAAQGELFHNDDTRALILERYAHLRLVEEADEGEERTGTFTSIIVAHAAGRRIALFFTGPRHAGENLARVLQERAAGLPPPLQMCDGLDRNLPRAFETVVLNCLSHGRRQIVDVAAVFPTPCRYLLEELGKVYLHDEQARDKKMSPAERLAFHQQHSQPVMDQLASWMKLQNDERLIEPSSGLGKAIHYLRKRWDKLTRFLHVAGAPLDNNIAERALKRAVLNRKNAMFYKTQFGAEVGDLYMSLIHTAELAGANTFEYLTALARHHERVAAEPGRWLPWNYAETLATLKPDG
jgi:hypothetical protein